MVIIIITFIRTQQTDQITQNSVDNISIVMEEEKYKYQYYHINLYIKYILTHYKCTLPKRYTENYKLILIANLKLYKHS